MTNNSSPGKTRITFAIPAELEIDIKCQLIADGYPLTAKSKWIAEAIENFLKIDNFEEIVSIHMMSELRKKETIVLDLLLKDRIDEATLKVKTKYPNLDGVQSLVIRTAIIQRLISPGTGRLVK